MMNSMKLTLAGAATLFLSACAATPYGTFVGAMNQNLSLEEVKATVTPQLDLASQGEYWGPPLCAAIKYDRVDVVEYLVEKGASIDMCNGVGGAKSASPMHMVAGFNSPKSARYLLALGANTDMRNRDNQTPLALARSEGNIEIVRLLETGEVANNAWKQAQSLNTSEAYASFIGQHGDSAYVPQAQDKLAQLREVDREKQLKRDKLAALEANLPLSVRKDKYMISLSKALKESRYQDALTFFDKLNALPGPQDASLSFFHGEALLQTGDTAGALQQLYKYVETQGSNATHYTRALSLINEAEGQL